MPLSYNPSSKTLGLIFSKDKGEKKRMNETKEDSQLEAEEMSHVEARPLGDQIITVDLLQKLGGWGNEGASGSGCRARLLYR